MSEVAGVSSDPELNTYLGTHARAHTYIQENHTALGRMKDRNIFYPSLLLAHTLSFSFSPNDSIRLI